MKKKLVSSLLKCSLIIIVSFAGGAFASFVMNHNDNIPNGGVTKTSKVNYNNITPTTKAVKKVQNSVVSVINYKQQESRSDLSDFYSHFFGNQGGNTDKGLQVYGEGSGVIYKKDGKNAYVVTNNHVIDGAKQIEIQLADGSKAVGKLVGSDIYSDLAVVKIPSDKVSNIAEFADSSKLNIGETAIAIGSPLGTEYANSVTQGIVSSLKRTVTMTNEEGQTVSTNAIQTDAAINPGNSGGALINIEGQVIGINSSKISSTSNQTSGQSSGNSVEGMGFAIPSNDVVKIINQLESNGQVERPALGISMAGLSNLPSDVISKLKIPSNVTNGIVVASIQSGMPAQGKLKKYDVITKVDDKEVVSPSDLQSLLYGHQVGDSITVTFYRGENKQTVTIKLTKTSKDLAKQRANN